MATQEKQLTDIDEVEQKHAYLEDSKFPQFMKREDLIAAMSKIKENIGRKRHLIRFMNDQWKSIDNEIRRWENKNNMLEQFDNNLKQEEDDLNKNILKIRQARKKAGMDAMFKQYMGDNLRKRLKNIIDQYGSIQEQPEEMVKSKMAAQKAEDSAESVTKIKELLKKKREGNKEEQEQPNQQQSQEQQEQSQQQNQQQPQQ